MLDVGKILRCQLEFDLVLLWVDFWLNFMLLAQVFAEGLFNFIWMERREEFGFFGEDSFVWFQFLLCVWLFSELFGTDRCSYITSIDLKLLFVHLLF